MKKLWLSAVVVSFTQACIAAPMADHSSTVADSQHSITAPALAPGEFQNPLFGNGADPWLSYWQGNYYLTTTTWTSQLVMRKSPTLAGLANATPTYVWSDTDPKRCCNFWAFEFHRLKGPNGYRWYLMYTAGTDGTLDHQHLNVLESAGDDPMGPYQYKGAPMPDVWNIDGSYLEHNNRLFLMYSQWQGDEQRNIIVELENPWTLKATSVPKVLTRPELAWEQSGRKVTEGPAVLKHQGRTFVSYSGSFCDTPDYKLGLLELVGDDPMADGAWQKFEQPVFSKTDTVFGPGHNGFFKSPDGREDWLIYHANAKTSEGCGATRSLRAQRVDWRADGSPDFGTPLDPSTVVAAPSGEDQPQTVTLPGAPVYLQPRAASTQASNQCLTAQGPKTCQAKAALVLDMLPATKPTAGLTVRLNTRDGQFLTATHKGVSAQPWQQQPAQMWLLQAKPAAPNAAIDGIVQLESQHRTLELTVQPQGSVVLVANHSGRVLSACADGAIAQQAWQAKACQQWQIRSKANGLWQLQNQADSKKCLQIDNNAVVAGAQVILGDCMQQSSDWQAVWTADGVLLNNAYSKQVLDIAHCGLADGTDIAQAPRLAGACQTFQLRQP